jgi:hypothetical protein
MWQEYLEAELPGTSRGSDGAPKTNKWNIVKKVVLDQTIGAVVNSAAFISFFSAAAGNDKSAIWRSVQSVSLFSYDF